ncbi:MAG: DJ-1/PfpI family protein [Oscillospiraceae bacterium]|jgi:4-methyl-5(b-hydroxyethyl)-thiazole monophosphate biosynthesis|nr:DJ-1/PfpI family protein [Oscillospiraceae bacterium]
MVYIILGEGFEEIEAVAPCDILRRGGVEVRLAAVGGGKAVKGAHGIALAADISAADIVPAKGDMLIIPGGMDGVRTIKADEDARQLIGRAAREGARLSAICAGPAVLAALGLTRGRHITCYPGTEGLMDGAVCQTDSAVVSDGELTTGRAPGAAIDFGLALLARLKGGAAADEVKKDLVY